MTTMASQITSLTVVYSTVYSDTDQRKHQSSALLAFVWGIHRDRWIPRTNGQLRGKCFHLMTSSCNAGSDSAGPRNETADGFGIAAPGHGQSPRDAEWRWVWRTYHQPWSQLFLSWNEHEHDLPQPGSQSDPHKAEYMGRLLLYICPDHDSDGLGLRKDQWNENLVILTKFWSVTEIVRNCYFREPFMKISSTSRYFGVVSVTVFLAKCHLHTVFVVPFCYDYTEFLKGQH